MKSNLTKIMIGLILVITACSLPWSAVSITASAMTNAEQPSDTLADDHTGPRGITLSWSQDPTQTQSVAWSSPTPGKGYVQFTAVRKEEINPDFLKSDQLPADCVEVAPGSLYRFQVTMKKLSPDTLYWYRVGDGTAWSAPETFRTASAKAGPYKFMFLGDVQFEIRDEDYDAWSKMIQKAYQDHPDIRFSLLGGDYVNSSGNVKDWNGFLNAAEPVFSKISMMTVPGNHETSILPLYYLKNFSLPENGPQNAPEEFYSFDYGDCHFVMLNTSIFLPERKNYMGTDAWVKLAEGVDQWLRNDLKSSNKKWKIVTMHHPAFGVAEDNEIYQIIRDRWVPALEDGKVDLVFCGHQHVAMRTGKIGGVTYFMGNSGQKRSHYYTESSKPDYVKFINDMESTYQIVEESSGKLTLSTFNQGNQLLDQVTLAKTDEGENTPEIDSGKTPGGAEKAMLFQDVSGKDWYYNGVKYVFSKNIFQGTSADCFSPKAPMTRGMFVTALSRLLQETSSMPCSFEDVRENQWYTQGVRWGADKGIVTGYNSKSFGVNDSITREQLASLLYRCAKYKGYDTTTDGNNLVGFQDAGQLSDWSGDAVEWALSQGILNGRSSTALEPKALTTRGETAVMIKRFAERYNL